MEQHVHEQWSGVILRTESGDGRDKATEAGVYRGAWTPLYMNEDVILQAVLSLR